MKLDSFIIYECNNKRNYRVQPFEVKHLPMFGGLFLVEGRNWLV